MTGRARANGEGSIYPYRNGYAAYAWVDTPTGRRQRKYVYGPTREVVHTKWFNLHREAARGRVATRIPTVKTYLTYWLEEVVRPNLAPATIANYDMFCRLYIVPELGNRRLDKLSVRDVQTWLNRLRDCCQCCSQGKDAARAEPRCCAAGNCCEQYASPRTIRDAWTTLRSALSHAVREELVTRNVATLVRLPTARPKKHKGWTVEEARRFLESAHQDGDPPYAAFVLILVLGLRRGEVLGLAWADVDQAELYIGWQVERVAGELLRRRTKTQASDAPLPLPDIALTALKERREQQDRWRDQARGAWLTGPGLVTTTRHGGAVEPRNVNRSFKARCVKAGVPEIAVHTPGAPAHRSWSHCTSTRASPCRS